jgi:hypothetical protein
VGFNGALGVADDWHGVFANGDISHEKGKKNEKKQPIIGISPSVIVVSATQIHTRVG